ncbi:MAG: hypothetical protein Q8N77_02680 [Nanoarchaeota archaeon]|nr:hypothetical protein [Nanoarchaeota archaeon]
MKIPTFTVDGSGQEAVPEVKKEEPVKKLEGITLQDLLGKEAFDIASELEVSTKPFEVNDFKTLADNYILTKSGIGKVKAVEYKHKQQEAWIDVHVIEYKEGKAEKDDKHLLTKQELLLENPDHKFEMFKFLVKGDYTVLIHSYAKGMEDSAKKIVDYYKNKFGMEEIEDRSYRKK